jgi:hypothetical protein
MEIVAIAKKAVQFAVQVGVSKIVHDIIANNVEMEKVHHKVAVPVASFAIGGAVADAASNYTDMFIDEIADVARKIANRNKEMELTLVKND